MQTGFDVSALMGSEDQQVWVDFNAEVKVKVRHVSREEQAKILKAATVITWDRNHQKESVIDMLKYGELIGEAAILDWSGLIANGETVVCSPDTIRILMRKWADFAKFISDICSDLERLVEADKETVRKNSVNTSLPEVITPQSVAKTAP